VERRAFLAGTGAVFLALPLAAEAQGQVKPTIAIVLSNTPLTDLIRLQPKDSNVRALLEAMGKLGWVDGQNVTVLRKSAEGHPDRYSALAKELVSLKVDLIVASGAVGAAVRQATSTIPIVRISGPVEKIARPGGNVTGVTTTSPALAEKRLELLKEAVSRIVRAAHLRDVAAGAPPDAAARALRLTLVPAPVDAPDRLQPALASIMRQRVDAMFVSDGGFFLANRSTIIEFAAKQRLPSMFSSDIFSRDGGLMSYGANYVDLFRRVATYVDKILRSAKPGDLPIQQPTKFELVINLKTAKALGLTIPPSLLARADEVIE